MCGTPWMIGLAALQGINQYNSQKQQYNAQAAMYNAQAQTAEQNARISEIKQEQVAEQYANQQRKLNDRMRLAVGNAAAEAGASGLALSGSPLDLLSSSYQTWHDDSNTLLGNQRNNIWSERMNELNYRNQASSYRASAANMQAQKRNALWGTILGTASSIYGIQRAYGANPTAQSDMPQLTPGFNTELSGMTPSWNWTFGTGKNGIQTTMGSGLFGGTAGSSYKIKYPWSK